jgi:cytochrome bd-type quinol oxidase subunit 1
LDYGTLFGVDPRTVVWFVAQIHLMFAGFVLGVPMFAVVVEAIGARTGEARWDRLARDFARLLSAAFATTAALGGLFLLVLIALYPTFMTSLAGVFSASFALYGLIFLGEAFVLYYWFYSWDVLASREPRSPSVARVFWWITGALAAGWFAFLLFAGPDLDIVAHQARADGQRVERWSEQLGPWLARGLEDDEDLEGYLADPLEQLVAWDVAQGVTAEPRIRAQAEALLAAALHIADGADVTPAAAEALLADGAARLAADARSEGGIAAATLSAGHWRRLLAMGIVVLLFSGAAAFFTSRKAFHVWFGLLLNVVGTALMFIANSWVTWTMSPTGIHETTGEFVGTTWQATANPLWNPLNLHRLLANMVLGGFVAAAYAGVRSLGAKSAEDRERYDWMGYVGNFIGMAALLPLPFAGYYLGREIYGFSPIMGNDMMGGTFSWSFILQALLIGMLFLGANYYLWVGMQRIPGANRYRRYVPWNTVILVICFAIWMTPHNLPLDAGQRALMAGETFHPVLKYFGLMSAKNAAVNLIIVSTFFSFLMYRRSNKGSLRPFAEQGLAAKVVLLGTLAAVLVGLLWYAALVLRTDPALLGVGDEVRWLFVGAAGAVLAQAAVAIVAVVMTLADRGKAAQTLVMLSTIALATCFLGVWGFLAMTAASGFLTSLAVCQTLIVLACLVLVAVIDVLIFSGSKVIGRIRWGSIPRRASYALIWNCVAVVMLMGLMGYVRSGMRQDWHVYGVLRDTSQWAFTPTHAEMAWKVALISFIYMGLLAFVFWLGDLTRRGGSSPEPAEGAEG